MSAGITKNDLSLEYADIIIFYKIFNCVDRNLQAKLFVIK